MCAVVLQQFATVCVCLCVCEPGGQSVQQQSATVGVYMNSPPFPIYCRAIFPSNTRHHSNRKTDVRALKYVMTCYLCSDIIFV